MKFRFYIRYFSKFWRSYILLCIPTLISPIFFIDWHSPIEATKCSFVVLVMVGYWVTEALPLAVTSMIPLVAFPVFGIMSTRDVSINYLNSSNFLFLGGLILALALENTGLHKRIAFSILLTFGTAVHLILLGFLSMWISNTASTAIMVPILDGIIEATQQKDNQGEVEKDKKIYKFKNLAYLSITYSASIGGTGVLSGSATNLIVPEVLQQKFGSETGLTFASWMAFTIPLTLVNLLLLWLWLWYLYRKESKEPYLIKRTLHGSCPLHQQLSVQYRSLGYMSCRELTVSIIFVVLLLLWFFRHPLFIPGWSDFFQPDFVDNSSATILIVILIFILPSKYEFWPFQKWSEPSRISEPIISWKAIETRLPWGVLLLIGSGYAISKACKQTGLTLWIIQRLSFLERLPIWLVQILCSMISATFSQILSNVTTSNILIPIVSDLSVLLCKNPLYLVMSTVVSCSYSFTLPVSTASNAIVYEHSGTMKACNMFKSGIVVNVFTLVTTTIAINSYAVPLYNLNEFPPWARTNSSNYC